MACQNYFLCPKNLFCIACHTAPGISLQSIAFMMTFGDISCPIRSTSVFLCCSHLSDKWHASSAIAWRVDVILYFCLFDLPQVRPKIPMTSQNLSEVIFNLPVIPLYRRFQGWAFSSSDLTLPAPNISPAFAFFPEGMQYSLLFLTSAQQLFAPGQGGLLVELQWWP